MTAGAIISKGQRPIIRVGTTVGLGAIGGLKHVGASIINRKLVQDNIEHNQIINNNNDNPPSPGDRDGFINSFYEDLYDNPVELLLFCI